MTTQNARWDRMRDLFDQATELPTGQRESFVQRSNADISLREEVVALLHADQCQKKKPITGAIGAELEANLEARRQRLVGTSVGQYLLLSVLGHGGAGTVYLAKRVDGNDESTFAIKIVEGAVASADAYRRFKDERQILANLNHPNIARLFDAGDTSQSYPYVVMDYVEGLPIDKYCDRHCLTIRQRVELFLKACTAVDYAHQHLIIHRDLKPANILVTMDGTPKLLDFGIAKLMDTRAQTTNGQPLTLIADQLLTPDYASPEQLLGKSVTTSSDVYALGMVLYELLTGLRPYAIPNLSHLELENIISNLNIRPASDAINIALASARLDSYALQNIQRIAASRNTSLARLHLLLRGDLDSILSRALRQNPTDRYESVEQFVDDLRAHLTHGPVKARRGNWTYHAQRFLRQHWATTLTGTSFLVGILIGIWILSSRAKELAVERTLAFHEQQNSDAVTQFMTNVFAEGGSSQFRSHPVLATELLDSAARQIHAELNLQPEVRARLLEAIGRSYQRQGRADRSLSLLRESVDLYRRTSNPNLPRALQLLAKAQLSHGDVDSARQSLNQARYMLEQSGANESIAFATVLADLGRAEQANNNVDSARQFIERALALLRKQQADKEMGVALASLAVVLEWQDDYIAMEQALREAIRLYDHLQLPELDPDRLQAEGLLAECLLDEGRVEEAAPALERVNAENVKIFGETSTTIVHDLQNMIDLRRAQNRFEEAEIYAKEVLKIRSQRHDEHNYLIAFSRTTLAIVQWKLGKLAEAEKELTDALSTYRADLPPSHAYIASAEYFLAEVLLAQHRPRDALDHANVTLALIKQADGGAWRTARAENVTGQALLAMGRVIEAQTLLERSYQILSTSIGPDVATVQLAHDRLEKFYVARGDLEKLAALRSADAKRNIIKN